MLTYDQFIAAANAQDIHLMNLFAMGQRIQFDDAPQADALFEQALRLDQAGFVISLTRKYERRDGVLWQSFEAFIEPVAATYLARAAADRVQLSRDPLPVSP